MAEKKEDASNVMTFDALYTTNQIQKLKVLLPYIEPSMQKHLTIYIKYMEFQYTLNYVKKHPFTLSGCSLSQPPKPDLRKLCKELCLYSTPEEIRQLEQMQNILQTMETVQEMSQTMNAMQEIFPDLSMDGMTGFPDLGFSPTDGNETSSQASASSASPVLSMMMNMLTPEQREMYEMFERSSSGGDDQENGGSHEQ
ncbi:MAG: hypothetical protein K2M70_03185 [Lachnospiraceae bacterium]|nr:hypothetical protein [Lachnospiraceae bacterium]